MQEPHLLPDRKTARIIRLFVFRQTAVKSDDFIPRDQDPMALAKPELVRVFSDELIGFGRPLGHSAAVDMQQCQFKQSPPFLLPPWRKGKLVQPHGKLGWNLNQLITVSAGLFSSQISLLIQFTMQLQMLLRCKDREPELLKPAEAVLLLHTYNGRLGGWIRNKPGSDGSQGSGRGGGHNSAKGGTGDSLTLSKAERCLLTPPRNSEARVRPDNAAAPVAF